VDRVHGFVDHNQGVGSMVHGEPWCLVCRYAGNGMTKMCVFSLIGYRIKGFRTKDGMYVEHETDIMVPIGNQMIYRSWG
jgi:hypothetical protein